LTERFSITPVKTTRTAATIISHNI